MSTKSRPLRVLIADDHAPSREDIRRALERNERFRVCASVADAADPGGGFGLTSMRARAHSVGAELVISSVPGHGSRVEVTL